jgi:uncharacterized cysteine cluster protein YcgN (CxxCxxCC family)
MEDHLNYKEALKEVTKNNGYILKALPEKFLTSELLETAIKNNGKALEYVPEKYKTKRLCEIALDDPNLGFNDKILEYIPEKFRTEEICDKAISRNARDFYYVPLKFKTYERCKRAIENGAFLISVPKTLLNPELYRIACNNYGWVIEHVPEEERSPEICMIAVKKDGRALEYVPEKYKTPEICAIAYFQDNSCEKEWIPELEIDRNSIHSLKLYILRTPMENQKKEYVNDFIMKASKKDRDDVGNYISTNAISNDLIPLLTNASNSRLRHCVLKRLKN